MQARMPALLVRDDSWGRFAERVKADAFLAPVVQFTLRQADAILDAPLLTREVEGPRLLAISRAMLHRAIHLALAFRLTDDPKYARRLHDDLRAVCAFDDFNPSHFLDVAEMGAAIAIGVDWLGEHLEPALRAHCIDTLIEKVITPSLADDVWFWTKNNNWNSVCIAGVVMSAVIARERAPKLAEEILERSVACFHYGMETYKPDGIYPEGPVYWGYGTTFAIMAIETFRTANIAPPLPPIDASFGRSADYMLCNVGPSGDQFNFGDSHRSSAWPKVAMLYFATELNRPDLAASQRETLAKLAADKPDPMSVGDSRFGGLGLLWHRIEADEQYQRPDFSYVGQGITPLAFHQSGDMYLGIKAGAGSSSHAQLDAGTFVLDAKGQRFAHDLGADNYYALERNLNSFWRMEDGSDRWSLVRYNNRFHNTLTLDDLPHEAAGKTTILEHSAEPVRRTVVDLTPAFSTHARRVRREVKVHADRVEMTDQADGITPAMPVTWAMITDAQIERTDRGLVLRKADVSLAIEIIEPAGYEVLIDQVDEHKQPFESLDKTMSRIRIRTRAAEDVRIRVVMTLA